MLASTKFIVDVFFLERLASCKTRLAGCVVLLPELCGAVLTQYFLELNASVFLASGQKVVLASSLHASRFSSAMQVCNLFQAVQRSYSWFIPHALEIFSSIWRHHKPCWVLGLDMVSSRTMQSVDGSNLITMPQLGAVLLTLRVCVLHGGEERIEVECDNAFLVESLLADGSVNSRMVKLRLIYGILNREWKVYIHHILKSQNAVTGYMARLTIFGPPSLVIF
ncbi:hypothetical protein J1N35_028678 [Gossypium stocksii]|uniref:RNase H type-1 domain-containing protein n=1 Tax=Gossypium stocksii TaxID=47602 RepID=A0A9D3UWD6_9ROSI|nr:hypothetical protein J1N35_028678 [Gossypium stocksii]